MRRFSPPEEPIVMCKCCGLATDPQKEGRCPACGLEHLANSPDGIDRYRKIWINGGMVWTHGTAPPDWRPDQILAARALRLSLSRVKGRPPKMSPA